MNVEDYTELLKRSRKDIPKPEILPTGMWRVRAQRGHFFEPREADHNPRVVIWYKATEPLSDVDPDELGELPAEYDYGNTQLEAVFFLGELKDWDNLNSHLDLLGVDDDLSTEEALKAVGGREAVCFVDRDSFTDRATGEPRIRNVPKAFQAAD
jgi:hypothetical protein